MNKKGFTLIEILAVIIIIGIIATIGIASVTKNVSTSRQSAFVTLAKNYADSARNMRGKDDLYYDPKDGEAVILPYSQINGNEIENKDETGFGEIIPSYCYVSVVNEKGDYSYYINQVDDTYHFIDNKEYNSLNEEDIKVDIEKLAKYNVKELKNPLASFSIKYKDDTYSFKGVRVKFSANGGGKDVKLYGYFTSDSSYSKTTAHIKGNISLFDGFASTGKFSTTNNNKITVSGVDYTVTGYEIMYVIVTKN